MKTPDEDVGEKIIAEFKGEDLAPESILAKLTRKLVAGLLSPEDWKFAFEENDKAAEERK